MEHSPIPIPAVRRDGWTPERQTRFLDHLAHSGNVRAACARVGMSRETAYCLRRRDPLFARGWAAALVKARDHAEEVLADRAIDGIEEPVFYRGELIATKRKYDTRLLLAHLARLDRLAADPEAASDAARFDELLACLAGERVPAAIESEPDELPLDRAAAAAHFAEWAEREARDAGAQSDEAADDDTPEPREDREARCHAAWAHGQAEGAACWEDWFQRACAAVDAIVDEGAEPASRTVSDVSASPGEREEPSSSSG